MTTASIIWIVAAVVLAVIEAMTVALITIWFALGAVAASVAAQFGLNPIWQVGIFIVTSGILLCITRPVLKKIMVNKPQKTNADRVVGEEGLVIKKINRIENSGQVKIAGQVWTAVSNDGNDIEENTKVRIIRIEGVKLVVSKI